MIIEGLQIARRYWWVLLICVVLAVALPFLRAEAQLPEILPGANSSIYYGQSLDMPSSDSASAYAGFVDKELKLKITNGEDYPGFFEWAKLNINGYDPKIFVPANVKIDTETRLISVFAQGESKDQAVEHAELVAGSIGAYLPTIDDLSLGQSSVIFTASSPQTNEVLSPPVVAGSKWGEFVLAAFSGLFIGLVVAIFLNINREKKNSIPENK